MRESDIIQTMTESEIHAVMAAGFACIAGSLFSAYIAFGVRYYFCLQMSSSQEASNILQCICDGAYHSSKFVWAIGANLVVYIAL
uniref:Uncharacterized protein n=1 Tax=Parascaris equorum TaxID=6256 RepID=A0A914RBV7_PAREQ